jgi:hypothetical protein
MKYTIQLGWSVFNSVKEFMEVRRANIKTTQIFWYASGVDLSYCEYSIKQSPILIFLN